MTEDYEFSAQCAMLGERVHFVPEALIYDEQPLTSVSYTHLDVYKRQHMNQISTLPETVSLPTASTWACTSSSEMANAGWQNRQARAATISARDVYKRQDQACNEFLLIYGNNLPSNFVKSMV